MDNSKNGIQTRAWGPPAWFFLHSIVQNYPENPTCVQKKSYAQFFKSIGKVLPCRYCRESFQKFVTGRRLKSDIKEHCIDPDPLTKDDCKLKLTNKVLKSRDTLITWLYNIHNRINNKLNVKEIPSEESVKKYYEQFRSICTKTVDKTLKGCTQPSNDHSERLKIKLSIVKVDCDGNEISQPQDHSLLPLNLKGSLINSFGKTVIKLVSIKKSNKKDKKLMAQFNNGKIIHFGAKGMSDFTKHHDLSRKNRYIKRHRKDLKTGDPSRAGYLSMFILWNKGSLKASIANYKKRLNIYNKTGKFPTT
jgi:hypothetical protein